MKDAVLQRVKQIANTNCKSVNDFANKIGMIQNTVNNQVTGVRSISIDLILSTLRAFPDVSAEWLLRGEEPMLKSNKTTNTFNIKGTDNSVQLHGSSSVQGSVTTGGTDKEIMMKLIEQNQQLMAMLMKK